MDNVKSIILAFKDSIDEQLEIKLQLTGAERSAVHELARINKLYSFTVYAQDSTNTKYITITKIAPENKIEINNKFIETFSYWSSVPIPTTHPKYFEYSLDLLNQYYNARKQFELFFEAVKKENGVTQYVNKIMQLINTMNDDLKQIIDTNKLSVSTIEDKSFIKKQTIYSHDGHGKTFISIDIRKANYTVSKMLFPELYQGTESWVEYISKYTDDKFIHQSKMFREVMFGKNSFYRKMLEFAPQLLKLAKEYLDIQNDIIISLGGDEMILCADKISKEEFNIMKTKLNDKFPDHFSIEMFKLVRLDNRPYYVKEYIDGDYEFKCCPKKILFQCIKKYTENPIVEEDLKFMDEFGVATFDSPIF